MEIAVFFILIGASVGLWAGLSKLNTMWYHWSVNRKLRKHAESHQS